MRYVEAEEDESNDVEEVDKHSDHEAVNIPAPTPNKKPKVSRKRKTTKAEDIEEVEMAVKGDDLPESSKSKSTNSESKKTKKTGRKGRIGMGLLAVLGHGAGGRGV